MIVFVLFKGIRLNDRHDETEEKNWGQTEKEETRVKIIKLTTDPSTAISTSDASSHPPEKSMALPAQRSDVGGGGVTEVFLPDSDFSEMKETQQVFLNSLNFRLSVVFHILNV